MIHGACVSELGTAALQVPLPRLEEEEEEEDSDAMQVDSGSDPASTR